MGVIFIWGIGPTSRIFFSAKARFLVRRGNLAPHMRYYYGFMGYRTFLSLDRFSYFAFQQNEINFWLVTAAISTGLCSGASAIVTAHELGHHKPKSPGWILARLLLFSVNYSHFTTEHNHVHHISG